MARRLLAAFLVVLSCLMARPLAAQEHIKISGQAFADYEYLIASPVEEQEGQNGFGYRRLNLTTDFKLSDAFSGRARLEAKDSDIQAFVKDLYLKWSDGWAEGHELIFGLSSPPVFRISEGVWGYRSLEKTILDRSGIVSSRDMGVAARGPISSGGALRYGLMVANNSGVEAEANKQKRVYGQLQWFPTETLSFTLGGDYAAYDDERTDGTTLNVFAGYRTGGFRAGVEGFFNRITVAEATPTGEDTDDRAGVSVFGAARLAEAWEVVARFDQVEKDLRGSKGSESYLIGGLAYRPHANVRFIPNVLMSQQSEDDEAFLNGRITLEVTF